MTDFLHAQAWSAAIVFGLPATVYVTLLIRSWLRPTRNFVLFYGLYQLTWFLLATPLVALSWPLPPPARAAIATTLVHLAALAFAPTSTMARYPLCAIRYRRLPVVATRFAAGYTYRTPDQPDYAVTPFDDRLFRTPRDAAAAGFRPLRD
ncbi:MAG TPA: hypothetical protein VK611_07455 [Acidimicrobiales bacterium]|nr:hypothetical protein [Acidimicrobiales bacterium]